MFTILSINQHCLHFFWANQGVSVNNVGFVLQITESVNNVKPHALTIVMRDSYVLTEVLQICVLKG